jgi:putative peptidoglycan lipid II flippase
MNLFKAVGTVTLWTFASRVTGLAREMLIAATFGASALTDAFNVAFRIPNLLRRLFAEGAFSQAFVPLFGQVHASRSAEAQQRFLDAVATALFWTLVLTVVIGVAAAPLLVWLLASGLPSRGHEAAVVMTRLMFPYIGLIALVAMAAGILNTFKHFAVPAATPVLLNLAVIGAALGLSRYVDPPIYALAIGVMLGGLAQLALQWPALRRHAIAPRIGWGWRRAWADEDVRRLLRQMLPATLAVSVAQLSLIVNTQIASHLAVGSVTWLSLADRLMEFPTALLGVALGVVLLPSLTRAHTLGEQARYSELLDWGLRLVVLLALPCAVALALLAVPLSATLYQYDQFTARDVQQTALALSTYGVGLLGLIAVKVLAPGFFAQQDIKTPVRIALVVLLVTQALNLLFVPWLAHAGLTLSLSVGALLNAGLLLRGLMRRGSYVPAAGWGGFLLRVALANMLLALALHAAAVHWTWTALPVGRRWLLLAATIGACGLAYLLLLQLLGLRPLGYLRKQD